MKPALRRYNDGTPDIFPHDLGDGDEQCVAYDWACLPKGTKVYVHQAVYAYNNQGRTHQRAVLVGENWQSVISTFWWRQSTEALVAQTTNFASVHVPYDIPVLIEAIVPPEEVF